MYKLCWTQNSETKKKCYPSMKHIIDVMSHCVWSGEWVENKKGERLDIDLEEVCCQNLSFF